MTIGRHDGLITTVGTEIGFGDSAGTNYQECYHYTPWMDFGTPGEYKEILKIQPMFSAETGANILIYFQIDNETTWSSVLHTFTGDTIEQPILAVRALGRKFRFRIDVISSSPTENYDFTVYSMKIFYNERSLR